MSILKRILKSYTEEDLAEAISANDILKTKNILKSIHLRSFQYNHCTVCSVKNYHQILKILLEDKRCLPNNNANKPLIKSIKHNNIECFKLLMNEVKVLQSLNMETILSKIIEFNNVEVLKYLTEDLNINPFSEDYRTNEDFIFQCLHKGVDNISAQLFKNKNYVFNKYALVYIVEYNRTILLKDYLEAHHKELNNELLYNILDGMFSSALSHSNYKIIKLLHNQEEIRIFMKAHKTDITMEIQGLLLQENLANF
jgi:hypothetical protein